MSTLAVAARTPALRTALLAQSFTDWQIVDETDQVTQLGDLSVFHATPARYYLVSLGDEALIEALATAGTLLYWLVRAEVDQIAVLLLRDEAGQVAGVIVARSPFVQHPDIPKWTALVDDIVAHAKAIDVRTGAMVVAGAFRNIVQAPSGSAGGWRCGASLPGSGIEPVVAEGPSLLTCNSNNLYGATAILSDYCKVHESLPIVERVQHGWEPGPGVVVGAMQESKFRCYYVWSSQAKERLDLVCTERTWPITHPGLIELVPIGAPYLYLPPVEDAGPIMSSSLLAVPGHSIQASAVITPLDEYLDDLARFAADHGYDKITVLLHWKDDNPEARETVRRRGFLPATCGIPGDTSFLYRMRSFLRQHAAVTSDRICTAAMYSLYESRSFFLAGTIKNSPPDPWDSFVTDRAWIQQHYPGIAAGGLAGRDEALRELGVDDKRQPAELRRLLWGWVYG
mgnify:FL=1